MTEVVPDAYKPRIEKFLSTIPKERKIEAAEKLAYEVADRADIIRSSTHPDWEIDYCIERVHDQYETKRKKIA